jgi:subtilisin family serine protease
MSKPEFSYGGQNLQLTKSTEEVAIRLQRGAAMPPGTTGVSKSVQDFEMIKSNRDLDAKLDHLRTLPEVQSGSHVYYVNDETDVPFIPTGKLYVEFKANSDIVDHYELFEKWHFTVLEVVKAGAYRLQITPQSPNPIKCVIELQKHPMITVAEPEFATIPICYDFEAPRGSFSLTQWHLDNTGDAIPIIDIPNAVFGSSHFKRGADARVKEAWKYLGSLGSRNIKIAVIDTGFDTEHPMLFGDGTKIKAPFNARDRSSDAGPWYTTQDGSSDVFSHGTSCAAVAAGYLQNGVIGVAPNARIMPIRLDILSDEAIIAAFEHAFINGADVISCSLGYPKPVPLSTQVTNYLHRVARNGRGGKGIPMFFAAGNASVHSNGVPREISDFANHPAAFCVTASNSMDEASSYSFFGERAFCCGPTNGNDGVGITTAHCEVVNGALEHTYVSGFGGTSSATPLVAGVVALMLSVNPNLTLDEIRSMLRSNCDRIAGGYDNNGHSRTLGFGRINALQLVRAAHQKSTGAVSNVPSTPRPIPPTPPVGPPPPLVPVTPPSTTTGTRKGVVISNFLNVRSQPSLTADKIGRLTNGDKLDILEETGLWYKIGQGKYVHRDYVRVVSTSTLRTGRVTSTFLNVRSGPATGHTRIRQLHLNDQIRIHETTADGWFRIGTGEWVFGYYIRLE